MTLVRKLLATLAMSMLPTALLAQVIVGGPITPDKLEARFTTPPAVETLAKLTSHLEQVGDLTLDKATLTLPESRGGPGTFTLVARKLQLSSSRVITNGHTLVIYADELVADSASQVVSFTTTAGLPPNELPSGAYNGPHGIDGRDASDVTVYLTGGIADALALDLSAQDGQAGTIGGRGAPGAKGPAGRNGKCGPGGFSCRSGPGDGGRGGAGNVGGRGGDGGAGGGGGDLLIVYFNKDPNQSSLPKFTSRGGRPGEVGEGGPGGFGGPGGDKGRSGPCCGSTARGGPTGAQGDSGPSGGTKAPGKAGTLVARRQDLPL